MKIVFTGAEYYLSYYLNSLKIPMAIFFAIIIINCLVDMVDNGKQFTETFLYKNRKWLSVLAFFCSAYIFLVCR